MNYEIHFHTNINMLNENTMSINRLKSSIDQFIWRLLYIFFFNSLVQRPEESLKHISINAKIELTFRRGAHRCQFNV